MLTLDTAEGIYVVSVRENYQKPLSALEEAIEEGDTVKLEIRQFNELRNAKDRIGSIDSVYVELLEKAAKK